jgi:hypothetical protein
MRMRMLGQSFGWLIVVAALGVGLTFGVQLGPVTVNPYELGVLATASDGSPDEFHWE